MKERQNQKPSGMRESVAATLGDIDTRLLGVASELEDLRDAPVDASASAEALYETLHSVHHRLIRLRNEMTSVQDSFKTLRDSGKALHALQVLNERDIRLITPSQDRRWQRFASPKEFYLDRFDYILALIKQINARIEAVYQTRGVGMRIHDEALAELEQRNATQQ